MKGGRGTWKARHREPTLLIMGETIEGTGLSDMRERGAREDISLASCQPIDRGHNSRGQALLDYFTQGRPLPIV